MHPHLYRLLADEVLRDQHSAVPLPDTPARPCHGELKAGLVNASPRRTRRPRKTG